MNLNYAMICPLFCWPHSEKVLQVALLCVRVWIKTGQHLLFVLNQKSKVIEYKCKQKTFFPNTLSKFIYWETFYSSKRQYHCIKPAVSVVISGFLKRYRLRIKSLLIYLWSQKQLVSKNIFNPFNIFFSVALTKPDGAEVVDTHWGFPKVCSCYNLLSLRWNCKSNTFISRATMVVYKLCIRDENTIF